MANRMGPFKVRPLRGRNVWICLPRVPGGHPGLFMVRPLRGRNAGYEAELPQKIPVFKLENDPQMGNAPDFQHGKELLHIA